MPQAVTNDAMIALMGATGTGKSSFIHTLTGDENICIGHKQESQTDQVDLSVYVDPINKRSVTLIDTPGFDDSRDGVSDTDILQRVVDFLQAEGGRKLNGVIYLHRISDPRLSGNMKRNLRMFRELCGESALKNVYIATTNWGRVTKEEGDMRERELRESPNLFKPLLDAGAQLVRHDKGAVSAHSIVDDLLHKNPIKLQIQVELDAGKTLEETGAGSVLKEEIRALAEKHEAEMLALQEEMEEAARAKEAELLAELEEERQAMEQQRSKIQQDLKKLEQQTKRAMEDREARKRSLEAKAASENVTKSNTMEQETLEIAKAQKHGVENQKNHVRQGTGAARERGVKRKPRELRRRREDRRGVIERFADGYVDGLEQCVETGHEHLGILGAAAGGIAGLCVVGPLQGLKVAVSDHKSA